MMYHLAEMVHGETDKTKESVSGKNILILQLLFLLSYYFKSWYLTIGRVENFTIAALISIIIIIIIYF
jgi:ABC-type multidrug transport system permease subunit